MHDYAFFQTGDMGKFLILGNTIAVSDKLDWYSCFSAAAVYN